MKNLVFILGAFLLSSSVQAISAEDKVAFSSAYFNNNSVIFIENGVTFSVYPDGEFDFYIDNRVNIGANINFGRANLTFNSGFDYNPFVQYDDYGAVIQIENVPIYYDYYGRVNQIGDINIRYQNGRLRRVGGLQVYYNNRGFFSNFNGYVNFYNRQYVYHPFHTYFARPALGFCLVYNRPYRRFYNPIRYTYYRPYYNNVRRSYAHIGKEYRYNNRPNRTSVYRNDNRVVARDYSGRRNEGLVRNSGTDRNMKSTRDTRRTNVTGLNRTSGARSNNKSVNRSSETMVRRSGSVTSTKRQVTEGNKRSDVSRTPARREAAAPRTKMAQRSDVDKRAPEKAQRTSAARSTASTKRAGDKGNARSSSRTNGTRTRSGRVQ
jgi:hypothetical protein